VSQEPAFSQRAGTVIEALRWRRITEHSGGRFIGVECVCPDERIHRQRVEARRRDIPGWPATVSWEHVVRMRELWEPWDEPHLVVNTLEPAEASAARIIGELGGPPGPVTERLWVPRPAQGGRETRS